MPAGFLYDNAVATAAVSSDQATEAAMPITNLADPQPRRRARLMNSAASLIVDFGAEKSIDCAGLISTTLTGGATIRARVGSAEALVEAAPLVALDFMGATPSVMTGWSAARGGGGGVGEATYFDASGNLVEAAAGEWRVDHDPVTLVRRGLLLEPRRTNFIRNPRAEGAVAGAPGTLPTNWARYLTPGLSSSVVGQGIESNIPYVDIRFNGTTTTLEQTVLRFDENYAAAAVGQLWTGSTFIRLIGGNLTNIGNVFMMLPEWSAGPTFLGQNFTAISVNAATMPNSRQSFSATLDQPLTTLVALQISFAPLIGAIDCTFRVGAPQLEQGAFATSPILNPVGTYAVTTREADVGFKSLAIPGQFSLFTETLQSAVPAGLASASLYATYVGAGDGSAMAHQAVQVGGNNFVTSSANAAGSTIADFSDAAFSLNQVLRQASAYAPNSMAYSFNGSAAEVDNSGVLPSMTSIVIGQERSITYLRRLNLYASRLTNAQLVALSGTGSSLTATGTTADSGTVNAEAQGAAQGNVILTFPAPALGRILRIDITDATNFTDIGLLIAGALWRVQRGMAYGVREGRVILDRRERNPFTGAEFPVPAIANPRVAAFTLPSLSNSEARNQHRDLVRLLGAARDGLVIMELNDTLAERNRRAIWGAVNVPGEDAAASRDSFPLSSRAFRVVERL